MGKIRIIGGEHRSRQLPVLDYDGLRPTLDRVKETLFNWLGQDLTGKTCLDLFAGSGSLGFEAISRYAKNVIMVEQNSKVIKQLEQNKLLLRANNLQIIAGDGLKFMQICDVKFDVIFLDPPYNSVLLEKSLAQVKHVLAEDGVIYAEYQQECDLSQFTIIKQGKAGVVNFVLLQRKGI